jgi:hypothetical protein
MLGQRLSFRVPWTQALRSAIWKLLPLCNSPLVFFAATASWLVLSILSWRIWKKQLCR